MQRRTKAPRSVAFEAAENISTNMSANPTLGDVIAERLSRRDLVQGLLAVSAVSTALSPMASLAPGTAHAEISNTTPAFNFKEVAAGADDKHYVAEGYDADILIRWGDPVLPGAPAFDPHHLTPAGQAKQFGYNNDYLAYFALPGTAAPSEHGLLCVNHEYTNEELMFPGLGRQDARRGGPAAFAKMTQAIAEVEMMAHGGSVLEIKRTHGKWAVVANSKYARRITAGTEVRISGPAAGHARLKTAADPTGSRVFGMLNNCAGGRTPWGTWLSCEENINGYFSGDLAANHRESETTSEWGLPSRWYNWGDYFDRFNIGKEPNEANRFGWIVEINPFDPTSMPVKRTALGRFKHEGAAGILNKDGRYVIYSGDDQRFDYVYDSSPQGASMPAILPPTSICSTAAPFCRQIQCRRHRRLVAALHGQGALTEANGFASQADVVIEARTAADLLGATKMDRPEDVEANAKTNKVYVMLTNNSQRKPEQVDAANPRADNRFGHIIEIIPDAADHAADKVSLGDPGKVRGSLACGRRRDLQSQYLQGRLVRHARQLCRRCHGPAVDLHRRQLSQAHRPLRRSMGDGDRGRRARDLQALFSLSAWRRNVRPRIHTRRHHPLPGRAASRRDR